MPTPSVPQLTNPILRPFATLALSLLAGLAVTNAAAAASAWKIVDGPNPTQPGRQTEVRHEDQLVARLIHGEGQMKPYLHVHGVDGEQLTKGDPGGDFQHHRGIFIGWNQIRSDLGRYDLWHLNNGGTMTLKSLDRRETTADSATLVGTIEWRGGKKDDSGSDLLITETRTLTISRPQAGRTQIDARFRLHAARQLDLDGDLQHAGIHFRAAQEVADRRTETSYLTEPKDVVKGDALRWCRLLFPVGDKWYSVLQMNAPSNPVEELSRRDYGRFGYFFKRSLKKDEALEVRYRFVVAPSEAPANKPALSESQAKVAREESEKLYQAFAK